MKINLYWYRSWQKSDDGHFDHTVLVIAAKATSKFAVEDHAARFWGSGPIVMVSLTTTTIINVRVYNFC